MSFDMTERARRAYVTLVVCAALGVVAGCADGTESGFAREADDDSLIGSTPDGRPSEPAFDTTGHGAPVRGAEEDVPAGGGVPEGSEDVAAGGGVPEGSEDVATADAEEPVRRAVSVLHPTSGSEVTGTIEYRAVEPEGVEVRARVTGLPEGRHAFHVHVHGDCTAPDGESAGPHYPFLPGDTLPEPDVITGDIGELEADAGGRSTLTTLIPTARLDGPRSILGRSVIVHASPNDPSAPPDGDAGPRLACGVIGAASG